MDGVTFEDIERDGLELPAYDWGLDAHPPSRVHSAEASVRPLRTGREAKARRICGGVVLIGLLLWSVAAWIGAEFLVVTTDLPHADAIVVLSGAKAYLERTERAARLFNEGRAPVVLVTDDGLLSSWSPTRHTNPSYAERAADELMRLGVGAEHIRIVPGVVSGGTHVEATRLRGYASSEHLKSVLIVTSPYHARRARWTIRRAFGGSGIEVGMAVTDHPALESCLWWMFPSGWNAVGQEYVKLGYYLVRYH